MFLICFYCVPHVFCVFQSGDGAVRECKLFSLALRVPSVFLMCFVFSYQVTEPYGNASYSVWHFDTGQTFAQTYLKLFINDSGVTSHIQTVTQCQVCPLYVIWPIYVLYAWTILASLRTFRPLHDARFRLCICICAHTVWVWVWVWV